MLTEPNQERTMSLISAHCSLPQNSSWMLPGDIRSA